MSGQQHCFDHSKFDTKCKRNLLLSRLEKLKEFEIPTQVNSAALHPENSVFVCGGEDFKMYKFDYLTGAEIGKLPGL